MKEDVGAERKVARRFGGLHARPIGIRGTRFERVARWCATLGGAVLVATMCSCGSSGDGSSIVGDLSTDMVITQDTTIQSELHAKNLTINDGVKVSSPGDLKIQTAGTVTLNGHVAPTGALTVITAGGIATGTNGQIDAGDGDVVMVADTAKIPTAADLDADWAAGNQIGGPLTRSKGGRGRAGPGWSIPPTVFRPGVRGRSVWIYADGPVNLGRPGVNVVQNMPAGKDGTDDLNKGCTATGTNGSRGGTYSVRTSDAMTINSFTLNLAPGGRGGNATTLTTCCPATAKGGKGGDTGTGTLQAGAGITVNSSLTVNYGAGGPGGDATGTAKDQDTVASCPVASACDATATGGTGGKGALVSKASGNVTGTNLVSVNGAPGGKGGDATAKGGKGGTSTCCPAGQGGAGGKATTTGGTGGDSTATVSGGIGTGSGYVGGNGGNANPTGGVGGKGSTCCSPPQPGGKGGKGGDATATTGTGGTGTNTNGTNGTANGAAGNGGVGGDGQGPGAAGDGGTGTGVPNGNPGTPGNPCPAGGGCTNEIEPNDTEQTGTPLTGPATAGQSVNGCGTLSDVNDKDHFCTTLTAGAYQVQVTQVPAGGAGLYLHVGNNTPTSSQLNGPATTPFTVPSDGTRVYIGFFSGNGDYKFTLTKTQ